MTLRTATIRWRDFLTEEIVSGGCTIRPRSTIKGNWWQGDHGAFVIAREIPVELDADGVGTVQLRPTPTHGYYEIRHDYYGSRSLHRFTMPDADADVFDPDHAYQTPAAPPVGQLVPSQVPDGFIVQRMLAAGISLGGDGISPEQAAKLAGIEDGATADQTGQEIAARLNALLGGQGWQTRQRTNQELVDGIDAILGNTNWRTGANLRTVPVDGTPGQFLRRGADIQGGHPLYAWGDVRELPAIAQGDAGKIPSVLQDETGYTLVNPPMPGEPGDSTSTEADWASADNEDDIPTAKLGALTGSTGTIAEDDLPEQIACTQADRSQTTAAITVPDHAFRRIVEVDIDVVLAELEGFQPSIQVQVVFGATVHQSKSIDPDVDGSFTFELPAGRENFAMAMTCPGGRSFRATLDVTRVEYRHGTWAEMDEHIEALAQKEAHDVLVERAPNTLHVSEQGTLLGNDPYEQIDFQAPGWRFLAPADNTPYRGRTLIVHPGLTATDADGNQLTPISNGQTADGAAATGFPAQTLIAGSGIVLVAKAGGNQLEIQAAAFPQFGHVSFGAVSAGGEIAATPVMPAGTYALYVEMRDTALQFGRDWLWQATIPVHAFPQTNDQADNGHIRRFLMDTHNPTQAREGDSVGFRLARRANALDAAVTEWVLSTTLTGIVFVRADWLTFA